MNSFRKSNDRAFSLVEVVLALGITSFVLVGLVGLLSTGLKSSRESEDQIQAANFASMVIASRRASPINGLPNFAIPATVLTNAYGKAYNGGTASNSYLKWDGTLTASSSGAVYQVICMAGTNKMTGSGMAQVYFVLSWPPQMNLTNVNAKRYEIVTYIQTK